MSGGGRNGGCISGVGIGNGGCGDGNSGGSRVGIGGDGSGYGSDDGSSGVCVDEWSPDSQAYLRHP